MPIRRHDFRSDTVTLPTTAMMAAILHAPLGDAARGDDPTVNRLQALACELTGKDDALLLPSGTMANLAAVIAHDCRGAEVIVDASSHLYNAEGGGLSAAAGALARPVAGGGETLGAQHLRAAIRDASDAALAPTRLVCVENTHNAAGGVVYGVDAMAAIRAVARDAGIAVHLDGARLFNAGAFLGVAIRDLCAQADSVWFSLCKGLGAPLGAILAGNGDFMARARRAARMLGGGMRQAGVIAAPALVALEDPYPMHRRDHALARRLAAGIARIDDRLVDVGHVQTNIVNCWFDRYGGDASAINRALRDRGILALAKGSKIRFVTHACVDDASVDAALAALADTLGSFVFAGEVRPAGA